MTHCALSVKRETRLHSRGGGLLNENGEAVLLEVCRDALGVRLRRS